MTTRPAADEATFDERLLAEAVYSYERGGTQRVSLVDRSVPVHSGGFEAVLIRRASSLQVAGALRTALVRVRRWMSWAMLAIIILGIGIGGALAGSMLSTPGGTPVNFYWLLLVAFALQLLALILWCVLGFLPGLGATAGFVGRALLATGDWLSRRARPARATLAAVRAWTTVLRSPRLGRWGLGVASHGLWLSANIAFLALATLLLTTKSFTFDWQTTILPDSVFVHLTRGVAWLPEQLGFSAPSQLQIEACGPGASPEALADARTAWAGLLIGCIVVYGIIPRAALCLVSLIGWRTEKRRYRLDLDRFDRAYSDLRPTVHASTRGLASPRDEGADEDIHALAVGRNTTAPRRRPAGPPAIIGLELPEGIPDDILPGIDTWSIIGNVDGRADRDAIFQQLDDSATEPSVTLIVIDLASTPDTGHAAFLLEVAQRITHPIKVILSGGCKLAADLDDIEGQAQRLGQWRDLLKRSGVRPERTFVLDLNMLTAHARDVLRQQISGSSTIESQRPRFAWWRAACDVLDRWAAGGAGADDDSVSKATEALEAVAADPSPQASVSAALDRASKRQAELKSAVHARAQATRQTVEHPIRAAARRAVRSRRSQSVGTRRTAGPMNDATLAAATELCALAMQLDLQARCDPPVMLELVDRVCSGVSADADVRDFVSLVSNRYEGICTSEGIA